MDTDTQDRVLCKLSFTHAKVWFKGPQTYMLISYKSICMDNYCSILPPLAHYSIENAELSHHSCTFSTRR